MASRSLLARVSRWAMVCGVVVSVLLAIAWLGSTRFELRLAGEPWFYFAGTVGSGALRIDVLLRGPDGSRSGFGNPGWHLTDSGKLGLRVVPRVFRTRLMQSVVLPLWLPLAAAIFATVALRRVGARRDPMACRGCGYDLIGLAPGAPCPECGGTAAPRAG